jgi:hypothetical protein
MRGERNSTSGNQKHVVVLIHGIRTQAEWGTRVAQILSSDPNVVVKPIRYEFFDVVRFLFPFDWFRRVAVHRVERFLRAVLEEKPEHLSIIAHSFGTYIVSRIIEDEFDIRLHRLIFCGSIVRDDFPWQNYGHRFDKDSSGNWCAVNDCGWRDIWPVFAKSMTWGYGASGRFGFGNPKICDRFFDYNHGEFFSKEHVSEYWQPYISNGTIKPGLAERPSNAWWVSVLTVVKLRWALVACFVVGLSVPVAQYFHDRDLAEKRALEQQRAAQALEEANARREAQELKETQALADRTKKAHDIAVSILGALYRRAFDGNYTARMASNANVATKIVDSIEQGRGQVQAQVLAFADVATPAQTAALKKMTDDLEALSRAVASIPSMSGGWPPLGGGFQPPEAKQAEAARDRFVSSMNAFAEEMGVRIPKRE